MILKSELDNLRDIAKFKLTQIATGFPNQEDEPIDVNPKFILSMIEALEDCRRALKFYGTFQPRQHPDGYYEIHIEPGEGGENRFGYKAKEVLEKHFGGEK